jgi:hypothetical protein
MTRLFCFHPVCLSYVFGPPSVRCTLLQPSKTHLSRKRCSSSHCRTKETH